MKRQHNVIMGCFLVAMLVGATVQVANADVSALYYAANGWSTPGGITGRLGDVKGSSSSGRTVIVNCVGSYNQCWKLSEDGTVIVVYSISTTSTPDYSDACLGLSDVTQTYP
ncbi:MAG: hypothetical protein ABI778_12605 [Ignavibacteriota bacterium]